MSDADSNDIKMADEASGEQSGVASTESDMECEKVSGTIESGDPLPSVGGVTADQETGCEASVVENIVKPEEALKFETTTKSNVAMECVGKRDGVKAEEALKSVTTDASDIVKDEMECEEISDEPNSMDTSEEIREESKAAETDAESLAHSERKDKMVCEDASEVESEGAKSSLKESKLPADTEEKLSETSNDVSGKVDALKLGDREKDGMECVSDKLQSEDATARKSSESKSVQVGGTAPSDESSNDELIIGRKAASANVLEFLGKSYDMRNLSLPYSPSPGELADESNHSVPDSLSSTSSERTRPEDEKPVAPPEVIAEVPKSAGVRYSIVSSESSVYSSIYSSDTRELTSHETTEVPKTDPSTCTSSSELVLEKKESKVLGNSLTESLSTNAVDSSSASVELILPEDTKLKEMASDDTIIDTISVPVQTEHAELVIMKEAEVVEEPEAKPVHLSPKKTQTAQTEKNVELFTEKSETSDVLGIQQEHSNVELPMEQHESAAATSEDGHSGVEEPRSHGGVKRRMSTDEEHFGSPKKMHKKPEDCT